MHYKSKRACHTSTRPIIVVWVFEISCMAKPTRMGVITACEKSRNTLMIVRRVGLEDGFTYKHKHWMKYDLTSQFHLARCPWPGAWTLPQTTSDAPATATSTDANDHAASPSAISTSAHTIPPTGAAALRRSRPGAVASNRRSSSSS